MSDVNEKIDDLLPDRTTVSRIVNRIPLENPTEDLLDAAHRSADNSLSTSSSSAVDGFVGIPAKPAVYACFSEDGTPIVAATTANLRNALKNRISNQTAAKKRVNYAEITDTIRFRRVGSAFAASWWYYRTVRTLFPQRYAAMLAWKPAWFITLNPEMDFPRFQISNTLSEPPGVNVGPLLSRRKARGIVESMEDLFDLCRYYEILRQAPAGTPCAYKELGKCRSPCDGSISMLEYRQQINSAIGFLSDSNGARMKWFDDQEQRIREAALRMDFRLAATYKRKLDLADKLNNGKLAEVHNMDTWKHLIIQRGKTEKWIAPFVAGPQWIASLPEVQAVAAAQWVSSWMTVCNLELSDYPIAGGFPVEEISALVTYHKYRPGEAGLYIPMDGTIDAETIQKGVQFWLNYEGDYDMPEINSAFPSASLSADEKPEA